MVTTPALIACQVSQTFKDRCSQTILLKVHHRQTCSNLTIHRKLPKNCCIWTKIVVMIIKKVIAKSNNKLSIQKTNNLMMNLRRSSRRLCETCSKSTAKKVARVCRESWLGHLRMSSRERAKWTSSLSGTAC